MTHVDCRYCKTKLYLFHYLYILLDVAWRKLLKGVTFDVARNKRQGDCPRFLEAQWIWKTSLGQDPTALCEASPPTPQGSMWRCKFIGFFPLHQQWGGEQSSLRSLSSARKTTTRNFHHPGGNREMYKQISPVCPTENSREIVCSASYETVAGAPTGM